MFTNLQKKRKKKTKLPENCCLFGLRFCPWRLSPCYNYIWCMVYENLLECILNKIFETIVCKSLFELLLLLVVFSNAVLGYVVTLIVFVVLSHQTWSCGTFEARILPVLVNWMIRAVGFTITLELINYAPTDCFFPIICC